MPFTPRCLQKSSYVMLRGIRTPYDQRSALALDSRSRPADVSGRSLRKPLTGAETAEVRQHR